MLTPEEQREEREFFGPILAKQKGLNVLYNIASGIDSLIGTRLRDTVYAAQCEVYREVLRRGQYDSFMHKTSD